MTTIKGNEIKANMTLAIEYGREGNFVNVVVERIETASWNANTLVVYGTTTQGTEVDFCVKVNAEVELAEEVKAVA